MKQLLILITLILLFTQCKKEEVEPDKIFTVYTYLFRQGNEIPYSTSFKIDGQNYTTSSNGKWSKSYKHGSKLNVEIYFGQTLHKETINLIRDYEVKYQF